MLISTGQRFRCRLLGLLLSAHLVGGSSLLKADGITVVYDLEYQGPATSSVDECPRLGPCFTYPIIGHIGVTYDPFSPRLENIDSDILEPPGGIPGSDPSYSSYFWAHLDLFVGEYLSDVAGDASTVDVPMRFTWPLLSPLPAPELYVFTEGARNLLTLTGGIVGIAADPIPNTIAFSVHGRAIPEPTTWLFLLGGSTSLLTSRWHQRSHHRCATTKR